MQRGTGRTVRQRQQVLAGPSEVVVQRLRAQPEQWFLVAGSDYCRLPDEHAPDCRCAVRVLTQTAYRIRERTLGAFASVKEGCFKAVALAAERRPDRRYDVEIRAAWTRDCSRC